MFGQLNWYRLVQIQSPAKNFGSVIFFLFYLFFYFFKWASVPDYLPKN